MVTTMAKTNPALQDSIRKLEEAGRKNDVPAYTRAAEELKKPGRRHAEVNLSRINRDAEDGDLVLVPGKVLGAGYLDKDVTVAAFQFSRSAREAIEEDGEALFIEELPEENPDGEQVRIMR